MMAVGMERFAATAAAFPRSSRNARASLASPFSALHHHLEAGPLALRRLHDVLEDLCAQLLPAGEESPVPLLEGFQAAIRAKHHRVLPAVLRPPAYLDGRPLHARLPSPAGHCPVQRRSRQQRVVEGGRECLGARAGGRSSRGHHRREARPVQLLGNDAEQGGAGRP